MAIISISGGVRVSWVQKICLPQHNRVIFDIERLWSEDQRVVDATGEGRWRPRQRPGPVQIVEERERSRQRTCASDAGRGESSCSDGERARADDNTSRAGCTGDGRRLLHGEREALQRIGFAQVRCCDSQAIHPCGACSPGSRSTSSADQSVRFRFRNCTTGHRGARAHNLPGETTSHPRGPAAYHSAGGECVDGVLTCAIGRALYPKLPRSFTRTRNGRILAANGERWPPRFRPRSPKQEGNECL